MTNEEIIKILWAMVDEKGSQKAVADILKISPSYLNDILSGNRAISDKVAKEVGYFKKTVYEPIDGVE